MTCRGRSASSARGRSTGSCARPPDGTSSARAADAELEDYLHLHLANRGVLLTPFHNTALMSPATSAADVDRHSEVFAAAVA
jgi:glutamate-1-semialdehyde 2,1-aminomutase